MMEIHTRVFYNCSGVMNCKDSYICQNECTHTKYKEFAIDPESVKIAEEFLKRFNIAAYEFAEDHIFVTFSEKEGIE